MRASDGESAAVEVKVAYLCSLYPAISHTFIAREIAALRELGAEIATFSIHRASAKDLLSDADRAAYESTFAILPVRWRKLLAAHLQAIVAGPLAYLATLKLALRLAPRGARGLLWQLFYFVEAVVLWQQCDRREVRHIHAHLANVAADVALLAAALGTAIERERPWSWSFTMHGPTEFFDVGHFRLALKLRHARFVICISDFARSQLIAVSDLDVSRKLHVVHCGVPLDRFTRTLAAGAAGSARLEARADALPTILYVGRLVPEKGQGVLLQAIAQLHERGRPVRATLVGEGPQRRSLEAIAEQLDLTAHVRFTGALGQEQILPLYESASLFCLPSFAEGVPCVLMEAMAMELPVISTFVAGIPELVEDGVSGLLVAPGRADRLALALERLLVDPALCRDLASSAREKVVEQFSSERSAEQLYAIFAVELAPTPARRASAAALTALDAA
ncbi:MAG TPA: glycosyltransferase [Solirubrobacteraceae bacterium]|jgi:colanic acid/amylovoran biosynthesis glycosyltransferase|nr:glycosyltransferase [Solirubrobacteraceae bacterium]